MQKRSDLARWVALVLPIAIGLVASAILLIDYSRPAPVFCAAEAGCGAVRHTRFASFLGLPTPAWGVAGFLVFAFQSLLAGKLARVMLVAVGAVGALAAAALIGVQFAMKTICPYCMAADGSAIVVFVVSLVRLRRAWDPPESWRVRAIASAGYALSFAVPVIAGFALPPIAPPPVAAEIAKTPKGMVTTVDFVDFECPFCRDTNLELEKVVAAYKDRVRLVRKQVPLARIHPHALDAARAACCGEELGKGDEIARQLFSTPAEELTAEGCTKVAATLGLDPERFRACMADPSTDARIKADSDAFFKQASGHGLPTIFVGAERFEGAQDEATLEAAVKSALGG
jgi:protein-disulfide isomerase/uncharacterized membrane protein